MAKKITDIIKMFEYIKYYYYICQSNYKFKHKAIGIAINQNLIPKPTTPNNTNYNHKIMHRFLKKALVLTMLIFVGADLCAYGAPPAAKRGEIRIKLQPELAKQLGTKVRMRANGVMRTGAQPLDRAAQKVNAVSIRPMLPPSEKFAAQRKKYGLDRWYVVSFDETVGSEEARKLFAGTSGVERSEVVTPMSLQEGRKPFRVIPRSQIKAAAPGTGLPFNDPLLSRQWHYKNNGDIPYSVAGADINLYQAWAQTTGSSDVLVAVIDGGIDYTHEDLAANVYVNEAELNGRSGVDDDGNGYVDDVYGWNFCTNEPKIYPHSHGTHVAGTVAAVNGNGIGVCGVAGGNGTPGTGVKMLSCQVFDSRSGAGQGDFAAALVYAAEKGAVIAQCSWGWDSEGYYEQAVLDAIDYFTETASSDKMKGGLCIFALGNNGKNGDYYPGVYDKVVGVTAMTSELTPASYSTHSPKADIVAPGGLMDYGEQQGVLSTLPNNEYGYNEGTSMATPHVSGTAALILSKYGSPTFLNETLRTQLLTSVNDFYGFGDNYRVKGLFGSGYLDAGKAVQMNQTGGPEAVSDFTLQAAQDYISVTWTIPASPENSVNNHIIYYSKEAFTAQDDLSKLQSKVVDTKFYKTGDVVSADLENLENLTEYYVAVQAVSRWGASSALSAVKKISTNAGPKMTVAESKVELASTAAQPIAEGTLTIGNSAEGILKWQSGKRTVSARPQSVVRPRPGVLSAYKGRLAGTTAKAKAAVSAAPEYNADDYPVELSYYEQIWAMIGDTDRTLPNSMAQWFRVDPEKYPQGFNLTSLWLTSAGNGGTNPVIEIYRGDVSISQASLIQRVDYDYFMYNYNIALKEQLYFAPGESFWVVVHFDGGQERYPLPMALTTGENTAGYSYMSNDNGKTWTQLSEALKGSPYESQAAKFVWGIKARSLNPDWSTFLELDPSEGTVAPNEEQKVTVRADGSKLVNGSYTFNILLSGNETGSKVTKVPAKLSVSGNKADVRVPNVVDFGSVLVGQSKTVSVEFYNAGYGSFRGSNWSAGIYSDKISVSNANFQGPKSVSAGFPARTKVSVELTYAPVEAGSHSGVVSFTDYNGDVVKVLVQGVSTDPARLTVEPSVVDAGTITVGDEPREVEFTIANDGKYPLEYVFPKFSDKSVEGASDQHKFGYTVASTLEGYGAHEYTAPAQLLNSKDITSTFSDDVYVSAAIRPGFSFPYYGKNYDKLYITSFGGVMFALNENTFRSPLTPDSYGVPGTGLISAYGSQLQMGPDSKVEYATQDGKFVVSFKNVLAVVYDSDYAPVSFRIVLSPNGDIEILYDDYTPDGFFQGGSTLFCGINDPEVSDVVTLTSSDMSDYWGTQEPTADNSRYKQICSGTAVLFQAPKAQFITSLAPAYGLLSPGEKVTVTATVSATDALNAGDTFNQYAIVSNDPSPAVSAVRFNATVSGDNLSGKAEVESESVNFGEVFRSSEVTVPVNVTNSGRNMLTVNGATATDGLTVTNKFPAEINPGASLDILVTVPTAEERAINGKLTISTTDGDIEVAVSGKVIGCPEVALTLDAIEETVASGTPVSKTVEIANNGNEPLTYIFSADENTAITVPERDDTFVAYTYAAAVDNKAKFDWIDIETNGLGEQNSFRYYNQHDYVAVELPFEFPYYGQKYRKMYIYNTGFVSFTERHDDKIWPEPPAKFPSETLYTNIIAPYWGLHTMNTTKTGGTYHYVTDERAVISFMEYGNSMNYGVCYQLILEKDGSFKFQYKGYDENATIMSAFGLAGISNLDASQSIRLPERYIAFNNAVVFTPVKQNTLAPNAKDEIGIALNTDRMAGHYESEITVSTNVPGKETVVIPVSLTITGEAKPVIPADVTVTNVLGYRSTDYEDPMVQQGACYGATFKVENQGTATFTVTDVSYESPMIEDEWGSMPAFMLMAKLPAIDWITGEPTGDYQWQAVEPGFFTPVEVGKTPLEFGIPMMEGEYWITPGEYKVPVHITYGSGIDDENPKTVTVNVKFVVTPAPLMDIDKDEIRVEGVLDNHESVETLTISNLGEYGLDYTLTLDPTGVGEEVEDNGGGIAPWANTKPENAPGLVECKRLTPKDQSGNESYNVPADFTYTKALYYDAMPGRTEVFNYGANSLVDEYKAAVYYKAPASGFNISHIYMPVTIETAKDVRVKIEIVEGDDPEDATVLGRGSLYIEKQANAQSGSFYVVPLERPVYMNPGEEFCVVVTYPEGIKFPAYICYKEEPVSAGRYLGWTQGTGWFDVAQLFEDNYGSLGYILTCLETTEGSPWVSLTDTPEAGSVEPQGNTVVKVKLNAAAARMEKGNKAMLVVKTNDPALPLLNFPIYLDKNGSPVLEAPTSAVYAREGDVTNVEIAVSDPDNDVLTVSLSDPSGLAAFKVADGAENVTENEDGTLTLAGNAGLSVALTPDYGDNGSHKFTVTATDVAGHKAEATVRYEVERVNRAPIALDVENVVVKVGKVSEPKSLYDLFDEPDGQDLTFTLELENRSIAEAFTTSDAVVFYGVELGTTKAIVTATDPEGLSAQAELGVEVTDMDAIEDIVADSGNTLVSVVDNPAAETLRLRANVSGKATAELYGDNGSKVVSVPVELHSGDITGVNVASVSAGVYLLRVTMTDGTSEVHRVVVR